MTRKSEAISEELVARCKKELKAQGIRGENGRRLQAIISAKEHGIKKVAAIYAISRSTLMRWIERFESGGSSAFAVEAGRGRRSYLSAAQKEIVHAWVMQEGATITAKTLQHYIKEQFAIEVSHTTAFRLLKSLGFSYITPRPKHHKQTPQKQEEFKKNLQARLQAAPRKEVFFFDESRFGTHSRIGHGWFPKGSRTAVKAKLGFQNFYVYSAVSPKTGEDCSIIVPYVNAATLSVFLQEMARNLQGREAFLIMDQAGWHKADKLIVPKNIEILYLPPYSPELNPVERLWQHSKDALLKNKVYDTLEVLEEAVTLFFKQLSPSTISSVCATNYMYY